jgi:hypothetical protein
MHRHVLSALSITCLAAALAAQEMPQPGPEHRQLARMAGTWDVVVEMPGADGKSTQSKGVSTVKTMAGGFWLVDEFSGDMGGMKFEGLGVYGFDLGKKKFVQTWVDSVETSMMTMEGTYDAAGKVLTMTGSGGGGDGKRVNIRTTHTIVDKDTLVYQMYMAGPDGKEVQALKITYTRQKAKATDAPKKAEAPKKDEPAPKK